MQRTKKPWGPRAIAELIASKDRNSLYVTSTFFRDQQKYQAFCSYYAIMRVVDDRIDDLPATSRRSPSLCTRELDVVSAWESAVGSCYSGKTPTPTIIESCQHKHAEPLLQAFAESLQGFTVARELWTSFFSAMRSDLTRSGFATWRDFLAYAEGATVAPTTIYLSLIFVRRERGGKDVALPADFPLYECGRQLGVFAYVGHILRDLAEDVRNRDNALLCLAEDDLRASKVNIGTLRADVARGQASPPTRHLAATLVGRARAHLAEGRRLTQRTEGWLEDDCRFILELIITLYERVIDKIVACDYDCMGGRHRLTRREQEHAVREVAGQTGFGLHTRLRN